MFFGFWLFVGFLVNLFEDFEFFMFVVIGLCLVCFDLIVFDIFWCCEVCVLGIKLIIGFVEEDFNWLLSLFMCCVFCEV